MKIDLKKLSNEKLAYIIDFNIEYATFIIHKVIHGYKTKEKLKKYAYFLKELEEEAKNREDHLNNKQLKIQFI